VTATISTARRWAGVTLAITPVFAASLTCAPVLAAQAARATPAAAAAAPSLTWPAPPAPARIRFVRALDPATARSKPSVFSRILRVITGGHDEPQMLQPYGIAVGVDGKVYVADTFARTIHVFDVAKSKYSTIPVDGESLIGVAVVGAQVFVTDSVSGRVVGLDARGKVRWTIGRESGFLRPTGIAAGADRLYVVDTIMNCIVVVSLTGQRMSSFGERGGRPGQFNFPTNIARTADGRLLVTDAMNFRVQTFDSDGRYLDTFGHLGDGAGDFAKPKGIAVDSAGHIYVVEGFHDVVQIFDDRGRLLLAFGESGSGSGQFWLPSGIAIVNDVVYVADSANRRLQVFEYLREQP
jgi:DNA-binding beta-propeller fold protein YncE